MKKPIPTIGYASGIAANNPDTGLGPLVLRESQLIKKLPVKLQWKKILTTRKKSRGLAVIPEVAKLSKTLASLTYKLTEKKHKFLVLGGDHTSAIGTWSGVADALRKKRKNVGLIWIDAHMDSNTLQTTNTNNVHGMPLACLLGYGTSKLTQIRTKFPKILPQNLCLIAVRSYDKGEAELLKKLKVKVFYMDSIKKSGIKNILKKAVKLVTENTPYFGLSIDLDAFDSRDVPGVGLPSTPGIRLKDFYQALALLSLFSNKHFVGSEIVEFNPKKDIKQKTEKCIAEIINLLYGVR